MFSADCDYVNLRLWHSATVENVITTHSKYPGSQSVSQRSSAHMNVRKLCRYMLWNSTRGVLIRINNIEMERNKWKWK